MDGPVTAASNASPVPRGSGPCTGLVLTGGGARAAYQAGALAAIAKIVEKPTMPFQVIAGVSAGAINGTFVATGAEDFPNTVEALRQMWLSITPENVYRTDVGSLASIAFHWMRDLSGLLGTGRVNHLLDTAPLQELLERYLPVGQLPALFASKRLRAVATTATNYSTGTAVTFFDGDPTIKPWQRSARIGVRDTLSVHHVLASAAIPLFFQPVRLANAFYGDGCLRLGAPLSPAIHMGADRILAIGVRYARDPVQTSAMNLTGPLPLGTGLAPLAAETGRVTPPSVAQIGGVVMNAIFLDSLDTDVERMERINGTVATVPPERRSSLPQPLREIPVLVIRPSKDLGALANEESQHLPYLIRHLARGLGVHGSHGADLLSYFAFGSRYIRTLIELGYADTLARSAEVAQFLA